MISPRDVAELSGIRKRALRDDLVRAKQTIVEGFDLFIGAIDDAMSLEIADVRSPSLAQMEPLISAHVVAKRIGKGVSTVREMARNGRIPSVAVPGASGERKSWMFRMSDVERWLAGKPIAVPDTTAHSASSRTAGRTPRPLNRAGSER